MPLGLRIVVFSIIWTFMPLGHQAMLSGIVGIVIGVVIMAKSSSEKLTLSYELLQRQGKALSIGGILLAVGPFTAGMVLGSLPIAANDNGEGLGAIAWFTFFTAPLGLLSVIAGLVLLFMAKQRKSPKLPRLDSNQQPLD